MQKKSFTKSNSHSQITHCNVIIFYHLKISAAQIKKSRWKSVAILFQICPPVNLFLLNWYSYSAYLQTYYYAYIFISIVDLNYTLPNWQTRKLICMCITVPFISKGFYNAPTKNENKNEWQYIQINQSTFDGLIQCRHGRWKIWEFRLRLAQIRISTIITRITATLNVERIGYLTTKPFNSAILFTIFCSWWTSPY